MWVQLRASGATEGLVPVTFGLKGGLAMLTSRLKRLVSRFRRHRCPECGSDVRENFCDVCGYDLIRHTRDKASHPPVV